MPRYQYTQGEDGRQFPNIEQEDGTVNGYTLDVGGVITAAANPDPSKFAELIPPPPEKTKK